MKNRLLVQVGITVALLSTAVSFASAAGQPGNGPGGHRGQGGPRGFGPAAAPQIVMQAADNGVFVLAGPELVKYNAKLEKVASVKLVDQKSPKGDGSQRMGPAPMRMLEADMLVSPQGNGGQRVLVVIGDKFFNIDAATLAVKAKGNLPEIKRPGPAGHHANRNGQKPRGNHAQRMGPPPANAMAEDEEMLAPTAPGERDEDQVCPQPNDDETGFSPGGPQEWQLNRDYDKPMPGRSGMANVRGGHQPGMRMGMGMRMGPMPFAPEKTQLELQGNTLYILRGIQITAVRIDTGQIIGTASLLQLHKLDR